MRDVLCQSEPGVSLTGEQLSGTKLAVGKESREGNQISLNSVSFFFFFFSQLWIVWSGMQSSDSIPNVFRFILLCGGLYCERSSVRTTCSYKRDWRS